MIDVTDRFIRAARRSQHTGLPLHQTLTSEMIRRRNQIARGQIQGSAVVAIDQPIEHPQAVDREPPAALTVPSAIDDSRNPNPVPAITKPASALTAPEAPAPEKQAKVPRKTKAPKTTEQKVDEQAAAETVVTGTSVDPIPENRAAEEAAPALPQQTAEEIIALNKKRGNIGKKVKYIDPFKKERRGSIAFVIPSNVLPSEMNVSAKGSKRRDHISYVVETDSGSLVWPNSTASDIGMSIVRDGE